MVIAENTINGRKENRSSSSSIYWATLSLSPCLTKQKKKKELCFVFLLLLRLLLLVVFIEKKGKIPKNT